MSRAMLDGMHDDDETEFEEEESAAEWSGASRTPHKLSKRERETLDDLVDRLRRADASKIAGEQGSKRNHIGNTRYDLNSYTGGPDSIRDLCHIKKRKVR
jgi:hypothetical protein